MADTGIPLLAPAEAIDFFRAKGNRIGFAWQDVWQEEHARSFTVAKAMSRDILETIRKGVDDAIANGETLAQFRAKLTPLLQAKGWWGKAKMLDPASGTTKVVQLGSPRRLKIIYDMNMRMARAAGRWDKIQRTKDAFPYLRYTAVMDERTRPEHREWHGTILHVDDPWWDTHYPPCGWNCRCTVTQLDAETIAANGWTIGHNGGPPLDDTESYTNPRTGETIEMPAGIDPGFAYNVGKAWLGPLEPPPLLPPDLPALEPGVSPGGPVPGAPSPASLLPVEVTEAEAVEAFLEDVGGAPDAVTAEPIATLSGTEIGPLDAPIGEMRQNARWWLMERRDRPMERPKLGKVLITRNGVMESIGRSFEHWGGDLKLRATPAVPAVIQKGTMTRQPNMKPERKPRALDYLHFTAPVDVAGETREMTVVVERQVNGLFYYSHYFKIDPERSPTIVGGVSGGGGQSAAGRIGPAISDRSAADIGPAAAKVEDRVFTDASGWPLAIGRGWFRDAAGALSVPTGDRRRVLGLVGRAIARPDEIRLRWVKGVDGSPMLFRRYIARVDGLMVVVDVGKAGWRFATERDPGFSLARMTAGSLAWSSSQ